MLTGNMKIVTWLDIKNDSSSVLKPENSVHQGPVVQSLVSANRWLRGIKTYRFPWYLTLVSANHASSNPGLDVKETTWYQNDLQG